MRTYMEEYKYWLESDVVDSATKTELMGIAGNEAEIEGRFKAMLSFGTAGLRGTMKAGIGNMNVYTVRYATQGLANLIIEKGGQIGGDTEWLSLMIPETTQDCLRKRLQEYSRQTA